MRAAQIHDHVLATLRLLADHAIGNGVLVLREDVLVGLGHRSSAHVHFGGRADVTTTSRRSSLNWMRSSASFESSSTIFLLTSSTRVEVSVRRCVSFTRSW